MNKCIYISVFSFPYGKMAYTYIELFFFLLRRRKVFYSPMRTHIHTLMVALLPNTCTNLYPPGERGGFTQGHFNTQARRAGIESAIFRSRSHFGNYFHGAKDIIYVTYVTKKLRYIYLFHSDRIKITEMNK